MSVQNITRRAGPYVGTGLVSAYTFAFKVFRPEDVKVVRSESADASAQDEALKFGTDYTVKLNANQDEKAGGTVTLVSPLAEGLRLSILSAITPDQQMVLTNHDGFLPTTLNDSADKAIALIQELQELLGRGITVPATSGKAPEELFEELLSAAKNAQLSAEEAQRFAEICEEIKQNIFIYSWDIPHVVDTLDDVEKYPYDGFFAVGGYGDPGHHGQDISNRFVKARGSTELRTLGERFSDVVNVKDFGAKGDWKSDDTAAFTAFESKVKWQDVDLLGGVYRVTSLPNQNRYRNGKFLMGGILYPTDDIYSAKITAVSTNDGNYNAWPQDTAHTYKGALFSFYQTDLGHNSDYAHPVLAISVDGGNSFPYQQHLGTDKTFGQIVSSAAISDAGCQLAIMRQGKGTTYAADRTYRLLARRAFEYLAFATDERTLTAESVSGSEDIGLSFSFNHGLVKGDKLTFEYTNATVGGIDLSGEFTVTEVVTLQSVKVQKTETKTIPAASESQTVAVTEGGLRFNEYSKFRELKVNGVPFGTALKNLSGKAQNPAMVHSMCIVDDDVYCCAHGGDYGGSYIVKISNVSLETRSLSLKMLSQYGTEGTLCHLGNRVFLGGLRPEGTSYPARFFTYDEKADRVSLNDTRFGANRFLKSPFPVRKVGDKVVFCFSDNRATIPGTTTRFEGTVPIYIAYASISDILADTSSFEGKLKYEKVADAFYSNTSIGDGSAVGVPSLTAIGSNLYLFYSSEHPATIADRDGYPHTYCCRLDFSSVLGYRNKSPIPEINGPITTAFNGINRNYSSPDWQDIPFNITLYFSSGGTSGATVTQGLAAEFSSTAAEATVRFVDERVSGAKPFSIGHNFYRVRPSVLGTFKNKAKTNEGVGIAYSPNGSRMADSFTVVCRMNSTTQGTIEYGYGDVNVQVDLERPINWLETE